MRRFLDMSIDLLGICDLETRVLEVSDSWERILGWTRDELLGTPLLDYFHPDDLPRIEAELAALLDGRRRRRRATCGCGPRTARYRWVQGNARSDLDRPADLRHRRRHHRAQGAGGGPRPAASSSRSWSPRSPPGSSAPTPTAWPTRSSARIERAGQRAGRRPRPLPARRPAARQRVVLRVARTRAPASAGHADSIPTVTEWWFDTMRAGATLQLDDVEELARRAPRGRREPAGATACGRCSTCRCRRTGACWGFLAARHARSTARPRRRRASRSCGWPASRS